MRLRSLSPTDREPLAAALRATAAFSPAEIEVALELIDLGLRPAPDPGYRFVVAEVDATAVGYACWGATPLTDGVYDLYWIAVHPAQQHQRVGRALLEAVEADVRGAGGRLLLVETASKPEYAPTRVFYVRNGYCETARIRDFYRVGDDKIVYEKRFA